MLCHACALAVLVSSSFAADPEALPRFFHEKYQELEAARPAPPKAADFASRRAEVLARHAAALGAPLVHAPAPVTWRTVGAIERDGYAVQKVVFESRPGVIVPALLYLPAKRDGRVPAVLAVHGHWLEGKAAPAVQLHCIFLAKRGYAVLAVDAIGAGERSYRDPEKGQITYHGRQLGYAVLPSGLTLAGLQIEDNRRALDLLASLPEVDPERIGCTGASGGGNQTFHITAMDERVRAAVPVCFFGAYRGYIEGAHCACELIPGVLRNGEEGDIAGSIAPRPLMVIAAIRDGGAAFRIDDARRNIGVARSWYAAAGAGDLVCLAEFDCDHGYNREMREAMVAFFDRHLKGIDSGDRVPEPAIAAEDPASLACFGPEPPAGFRTVPEIACARGKELVAAFRAGGKPWADPAARESLRRILRDEVLGGLPAAGPPAFEARGPERTGGGLRIETGLLTSEPGMAIGLDVARRSGASGAPSRAVVVLHGPGAPAPTLPADLPADALLALAAVRGAGATGWPAGAAVDCSDYVIAQGSGVLGRPVLGMWVLDALRAVEHLQARFPGIRVAVHGEGAMGLVAILAGALDNRVAAVGTVDGLDSFLWPARFDDRWPLGIFAPGLLRCGDIADIATAIAPRPLAIGRPRSGGGAPGGEPLRALGFSPGDGTAEVIGRLIAALAAPPAPSTGRATWRITPLHTGLCWTGKSHVRPSL